MTEHNKKEPRNIRPRAGLLLVEPVATEETLSGGRIVLPEKAREGWVLGQFDVVAVGAGEVCEDEECERQHNLVQQFRDSVLIHQYVEHECPVEPGDWIYLPYRSLWPAAYDGERLYFALQSAVCAVIQPESLGKPADYSSRRVELECSICREFHGPEVIHACE